MLSYILKISEKLFDRLKTIYENQIVNKVVSMFLVFLFLISTSIGFLVSNNYLNIGILDTYFSNPFFAIEISFVALLMFEIFSLIFVLPKSVSSSVGKQLELLSLIFIRGAFKEFSHIEDFTLDSMSWHNLPDPLINMVFYALGSITIFTLLGFTNKLRKHTPLTKIEADTKSFIQKKKLLAIFLLLAFTIILIVDLTSLITNGYFVPSFHTIYTLLIFSDILIVLIALRYTLNYYKIFRYSAFVVATIFIRLALSVNPFYNVLIGVFATVFVLLLTLTYNYFLKDQPSDKLND